MLLIRIFKSIIQSVYDYFSLILTSIPKTRINEIEQAKNQSLALTYRAQELDYQLILIEDPNPLMTIPYKYTFLEIKRVVR